MIGPAIGRISSPDSNGERPWDDLEELSQEEERGGHGEEHQLEHRVTRVSETSPARHVAIFAYTEEPGVIGRVERTKRLFGRALPEHVAAEERRVRSVKRLD
jgi:hypothetical protein